MSRAALALLALLAGGRAAAAEVESLVEHGDENRIGLVILGDGYRADEQEKMSADARRLTEWLLRSSPFAEHEPMFTVRLVHLVSNVSGAGSGAPIDTALGSYHGCAGNFSLLCTATGEALRVAAEAFPAFDHAIVMVNSPLRGGSGGAVAVVSTDPTAGETLVHELGHSFGGLADEYDTPNPSYWDCSPELDCPEPNVTLRTAPAEIKWRAWIPAGVPLPTPAGYGDVVGLFEGARYHTTGIYRPTEWNCAMRSMRSVFCPVCTEALVLQIWSHARPYDAAAPEPGRVAPSACEPVTFSIRPAPIPGVAVSWTVDSKGACEKPLLSFPPGALAPGPHRVTALVGAPGALVRNDPADQLHALLTWEADLAACSPPAESPRTPLCTGWAVPVARLAAPTHAGERSTVVLDASGSSDADGDALFFRFRQVAGSPVELSIDPGGATARFVMPHLEGDATLRFEVVATDGVLSSEPATAELAVRDAPNRAPAISLSFPPEVEAGATARITAEGSDPDGDAVAFACAQTGGPAVQLDRAGPALWTFVAPELAADTAVEVRCTASDGQAQADAGASIVVRPRGSQPSQSSSSGGGHGGCGTGGAGALSAVALALAWLRRIAARSIRVQ